MAGQALRVFERHALFQQVGDGRHPERVRRQVAGQAGVFQPALHHTADVDDVHGGLGELPGLPVSGPKEGSVLAGRP